MHRPADTSNDSGGIVFRKQVPELGGLYLRPLRLGEDAATIHDWVNRPYAKYWRLQNTSVEDVKVAYVEISKHANVYVGHYNDAPTFLIECYRAIEDTIGGYYDAQPGDYGMHILIAPAQRPIANFSWQVFTFVMDYMFSDENVERVVVEPDVRNEKIHALNIRAGFEYQRLLDLPEKVAHLAFCTRAQYAAALRMANAE